MLASIGGGVGTNGNGPGHYDDSVFNAGALSPNQLYAMDIKIDDGLPTSGLVVEMSNYNTGGCCWVKASSLASNPCMSGIFYTDSAVDASTTPYTYKIGGSNGNNSTLGHGLAFRF